MKNIEELLKTASEIQSNIQEAEKQLKKITVVGEAGGGIVKITMNVGNNEVVNVHIDDACLNDLSVISDLIKTAINNAMTKLKQTRADKMPNIPNVPFM